MSLYTVEITIHNTTNKELSLSNINALGDWTTMFPDTTICSKSSSSGTIQNDMMVNGSVQVGDGNDNYTLQFTYGNGINHCSVNKIPPYPKPKVTFPISGTTMTVTLPIGPGNVSAT